MPEKLEVFLNRKHIGEIYIGVEMDRYELVYSLDWIEKGYAVSPHLNFKSCPHDSLKRFLANLLPEGKWLEELSITSQISKSNIFGLIAAIGKETTGSLTFELSGPSPIQSVTSFREISQTELTERINGRRNKSISIWDGKPRLSVAGVQDKLPILITPDGRMGFGEGELASTHILKFGKTPEMHLVINEYLCMELARMVGLPTAEVELARMGEPVLVVKRFDRQWGGTNLVNRLHLIDGCQMLDLPPTFKYERPFGKGGHASHIRSGATLPALFEACKHCRVPAAAIRDMVNWVLFQLLIGNSDAHAKNISFFVGPGGIDVAPAYDLVCLDMYGEKYDRELAMAIGDTFDPGEIQVYQLAEMCEACKLSQRQVSRALLSLCQKLLLQLTGMKLHLSIIDEEWEFAARLIGVIRERVLRYQEYAQILPKVVV